MAGPERCSTQTKHGSVEEAPKKVLFKIFFSDYILCVVLAIGLLFMLCRDTDLRCCDGQSGGKN